MNSLRESSWANIRDKLVAGHFDAAHMLAPAAIAVSLGIGQIETPLVAPVALGLNGNAFTVSKALFEALAARRRKATCPIPRVTAKALARIVAGAAKGGAAAHVRTCLSLFQSSLSIAPVVAGRPH